MSTEPDTPDDDADDFEPIGRATYSPEDNKLRIYPDGTRVDSVLSEAEYSSFKAAGYKWASKQECFVCPRWTPTAEDWALRLCGEIGDEDYSPTERSADRAERFGGYRDKRHDEATGHADTFDAGPSAFGHQNRARAERQAARHDRQRVRAVSQWSKAEYWQQRTEGVIAHALFKASAPVRRGRIKTVETDQRKHLKNIAEAQARYDAWQKVHDMEGADVLLSQGEGEQMNAAQRLAYSLANSSGIWWKAAHPTCEEANAKNREVHGRGFFEGFSAYDFLTKTEYLGCRFDTLTPKRVAALYLATVTNPATPGKSWHRWTSHFELRLTYERAMLANEGGTATETDMEPAGWIRPTARDAWRLRGAGGQWLQIVKVNKSNTTGRVVSVDVMAPTSNDFDRQGKAYGPDNPRPVVPVNVNIERLPEDAYRPPTDEERAAFSAKKKASKAPPVSLINPTDDDATRFQMLLNGLAEQAAKKHGKAVSKPREVERVTYAQYDRYSGDGSIYHVKQFTIAATTFKVRVRHRGFWDYQAADSVLVLTDKPQKPLPLDWEKAFAEINPEPADPVPAGQLF